MLVVVSSLSVDSLVESFVDPNFNMSFKINWKFFKVVVRKLDGSKDEVQVTNSQIDEDVLEVLASIEGVAESQHHVKVDGIGQEVLCTQSKHQ